jgi:predicted enzyme related to lactoylglutathione lyase
MGVSFSWRDKNEPDRVCHTAWSPFPADSTYFVPSKKDFMFNYRVENLEELLKVLAEEGVEIVGEIEEYEYGKFGWIMDPEGNKIELWEPVDEKLQP